MLEIRRQFTFTGESKIDGMTAESYSATIDENNLGTVGFSSYQTDPILYKANRAQCRLDKSEFEDTVYAFQDEMLAEREAQKLEV